MTKLKKKPQIKKDTKTVVCENRKFEPIRKTEIQAPFPPVVIDDLCLTFREGDAD